MRHKGEQTGSVRLRKGMYTIRFKTWQMKDGELQYLPTEKTIGPKENFPSRKAAELHGYATYVVQANAPKQAAHGIYTVEAFVEQRFKDDVLRRKIKAEGWFDSKMSMLKTHILPRFGKLKLDEVRRADVQEFMNELSEKYSPQTVHHIHILLGQIFEHAIDLEVLDRANPAHKVVLCPLTHKERGALTTDQVVQLAAKLPPQYGRILKLLVYTGLRIGEVLGLRWKSVDFEANTITIAEQFTNGKSVNRTKTPKSRRLIPLVPAAVSILKEELSATKWNGEEHPVFASERKPVPVQGKNVLRRYLKPAAEELGLEVVWHSTRHTTSTLVDRFATAAEKQALLGHTNTKTGLRYTHAEMEAVRQSLDAATKGMVQ